MEHLTKLLRDSYDLQENEPEKSAYWHLQQLRSGIKQLALHDVVSSLPSKEAMNEKVNTLIFENFEDDEIANRREYGFGFRACYRWIVSELKHK